MSLLHCLMSARKKGYAVICAHLNHQLRESAAKDQAHAEKICTLWGVPLIVSRADLSDQSGQSVEMAARQARYAFLEQAARETGSDCVAMAHNADDNTETVLLNLIRGTGLAGLCGIPYSRGRIIRPVLHIGREEIMAYISEHNIPYVEDESNSDTAYRRNALRHEVIPILKGMNPALNRAITKMTAHLRQDEDALNDQATRLANELSRQNENGSIAFPAEKLLSVPSAVAFRILRLLAARASANGLETVHIEALLSLCAKGQNGKITELPGGIAIKRNAHDLVFRYPGTDPSAPL